MIPIEQGLLGEKLQKYFHLASFRSGQKEIIEDIMKGNDVLGVLPTGSGKSLCYQLPAKLLKGATIVVSPLISLMIDQVKQLKAIQFKEVIALNSFMSMEERNTTFKTLHKYKIIYVSPEILQNNRLLYYLHKIKVSLFVIDEAHCISQWGPEFRTDYLKLSPIIKSLNNPRLLALSATTTLPVQKDIINSLERPHIKKHIYPMDRENITLCVQKVKNDAEKNRKINDILENYRIPTLIYFSSRATTETVAASIAEQFPSLRVAFYHSGMDQMDRTVVQQQFMNDQLDVICSTSAFGMGINKGNIRLIIHYHFPTELESFVQEIGRAGRDGRSSVSLLLYSGNDKNIPRSLIRNELPTEDNLARVLHFLSEMSVDNTPIPNDSDKMAATLFINETQWRFIHYQLEKNGIIKDNQLSSLNKSDWEKAFQTINDYRNKRMLIKESNLTEMIQWINETDCLRKHLYKRFQSSYTESSGSCCSNCGFSFYEWNPEETVSVNNINDSWKKRLEEILLIGVENEAK